MTTALATKTPTEQSQPKMIPHESHEEHRKNEGPRNADERTRERRVMVGVVPLRDADASYALDQGCSKHWHPYGGNREDYDTWQRAPARVDFLKAHRELVSNG